MTRKTKCRWCLKPIEVPIPDDEAMAKVIIGLSSKMGCNRCTDYHRKFRDTSEYLQELALYIKRNRLSDSQASLVRERIKANVTKLVSMAEEHYLISGLMADSDLFNEAILNDPDGAFLMCKEFERGVVEIARKTHGVSA